MERISESEFDPDGNGPEWYSRGGQPFTGIVVSEFDGQVVGEYVCRAGRVWGLQRQWSDDGSSLTEASYCLSGYLHGFRRTWHVGGWKISIAEYRFGVPVRERWWRADGSVKTTPPPEGEEKAELDRIAQETQQEIAERGGAPSEVPTPFMDLMPGEWDDPPNPGDAARWTAWAARDL